jgi:arylsulfatase A-like enzyme
MSLPAADFPSGTSASANVPVRRTAAPVRLRDIILLAITGALVSALVLVAYTEIRYRVLHILTWTNRELAWLSPIGYLVCFFIVAIPLIVLAKILPRWITLRVVATTFATVALFSAFLLYPKVHPLAELALALGLGVRVGAAVASRPERWLRVARLASIGIAVALGILGGAVGLGWRLRERWALQRRPILGQDAPNVILVILDTVRASSLSVYGYHRPTTPTLERLAKEGALFGNAFSAAPWTAPSHASMMTGLYASQTEAGYLTPMIDSAPTLAEALSAKGYATGAFMANTGYAGYQIGLSRGFARYEDFPVSFTQTLWSTTLAQTGTGRRLVVALGMRSRSRVLGALRNLDLRVVGIRQGEPRYAEEIADNFFRWRSKIGRGPYFAMLNFMDAHAPYDPPGRFRTAFTGSKPPEIDRYDGGIMYEDSIISSIVRRVEERGELDRTVLIVTSDHGEQWGEHGMESHGNSLYLPLLHVPLIVYGAGRIPAGTHVATEVSLRDLAATILDVTASPPRGVPGVSLAAAWKNAGHDRTRFSPVIAEVSPGINIPPTNPTSRGPMKASIDSSSHYIRYGDGVEQLFNWRTDPKELVDLAGQPDKAAELSRHRAQISRTLGIDWPSPARAPRP